MGAGRDTALPAFRLYRRYGSGGLGREQRHWTGSRHDTGMTSAPKGTGQTPARHSRFTTVLSSVYLSPRPDSGPWPVAYISRRPNLGQGDGYGLELGLGWG